MSSSEMDTPPKFWDISVTNNSNHNTQRKEKKPAIPAAVDPAVEIRSPSRLQQKIHATENKQMNPLSLKAKGINNNRMFSPGRIVYQTGSEATATTLSNNHSFSDSNNPDDFYVFDGELKDVENIRHLDRIA